jgi:hypothetical protein
MLPLAIQALVPNRRRFAELPPPGFAKLFHLIILDIRGVYVRRTHNAWPHDAVQLPHPSADSEVEITLDLFSDVEGRGIARQPHQGLGRQISPRSSISHSAHDATQHVAIMLEGRALIGCYFPGAGPLDGPVVFAGRRLAAPGWIVSDRH